MSEKNLLEIKDLHVNVEDKEILHGVNLEVGKDEVHVLMGTVKLVGTDAEAIVSNVTELLRNKELYRRMSETHNPYGDGHACERILSALTR